MTVLVDTSVWSFALRRKKSAVLNEEQKQLSVLLSQAITDGRVALIGLIRQELLSGIKDQTQFEKLRLHLRAFQDEVLDTADYEEAAKLYNVCRSRGVECGPVDMLICAVASRRRWTVLANDATLTRCLEVVHSAS
jgi:predicted nucleic acid-binding protein